MSLVTQWDSMDVLIVLYMLDLKAGAITHTDV